MGVLHNGQTHKTTSVRIVQLCGSCVAYLFRRTHRERKEKKLEKIEKGISICKRKKKEKENTQGC
jgi:hypothetical protein